MVSVWGEKINGSCFNCGEDTIYGYVPFGCHWSPVICDTCGDVPCDQSC